MHHANIIISKEDSRDFVFNIAKKDLNFNIKANPDFLLVENDSFGIDDARNLEKWVIGKPLTGEVKVSLVITKSITFEAQNALLKVLEEPPVGTYIFINLESLGGILPTFISRISILDTPRMPENIGEPTENVGYKFLKSKIKERLSLIRSLSKKEDKNDMKELIKNLEAVAYKEKRSTNQMRDALTAKIFATVRGSSPKMLLEWLSCVL